MFEYFAPPQGVRHARLRWIAVLALAALAAWAPRAVRAEITPEAREVIDRYLEATGGRAAFESVETVRLKATVQAMGLSGSLTSWQQRPDRRAADTHIGPLALKDGFDGTRGWRVMPDGKMVILDGKDLEDARASTWFENQRWLDADQGGGSVRLHGYEREGDVAYTLLDVAPPVGRPRTLWFNQTTGLLDRVEWQDDNRKVTVRQSDYREIDGRRMPFRSLTQIAGMPANDITVVLDSVWINPAIAEAQFAPPGGDAPKVTYLKTPGHARIPIEYRQRHVWLKASVNGGPPQDFLYDTGASITVIDSAYAAEIGLDLEGRLQAAGAGASGGASFAAIDAVRIEGPDGDGIELRDRNVAVLNINPHLAPFMWRDCAGIIGYDVISSFVNEIDFDGGTVTFHDPKTFAYAGEGASVPFRLAGTVPVIPITLDGTLEGEVRLDVGSSATVDLHSPFVKQHDLLARPGKKVEVTSGGFGGTFSSTLVRMKTLKVGPYVWNDPIVSLSGATTGALASEDYAGNAGNHVMERFKCTFDYERRVVHLEPGRRFTEPFRFDRAGVRFRRDGDALAVAEIIPGSPAEKAGLVTGDPLVSLDGRPAASWTLDELRTLFEEGKPGRKVKVETMHDGRKKKATMKLETIL